MEMKNIFHSSIIDVLTISTSTLNSHVLNTLIKPKESWLMVHNMCYISKNCIACSTILYSIVLYSTVPYFTVIYCTVLYCTILYHTVLYYTVLYCTVLYCTVLYCTVLYCTKNSVTIFPHWVNSQLVNMSYWNSQLFSFLVIFKLIYDL